MEQVPLIGFDYETHLMGPENLYPKPVCLSAALNEGKHTEDWTIDLASWDDYLDLATAADGNLADMAEKLLSSGIKLVGANVAFDLGVMGNSLGNWAQIFDAVSKGLVSDVQVREKLLNLADTGDLKYRTAPDGTTRMLDYSLGGLVADYLAIKMEGKTKTNSKGEVTEGADAWRLNYDALEEVPLGQWPLDAVEYAVLDSVYPTVIWRLQEERAAQIEADTGVYPLGTEHFRVFVRLALHMLSAHGVEIDPVVHAEIVAELAEALSPEKLVLLVDEGILRPGCDPQPYANGAKAHVEDCRGKARKTCDCPVKMTAGSKPSLNKKALEAFVLALAKEQPENVTLRYTEKGNLQVDKEFLTDHARFSPVLVQLKDRQAVQKLVTTDMPRMEWPKGSGLPARVLHAQFDFLKETGRTSSYASKIFPSWNCQNPHPRVRAAVVPREGYVLYSVDYSGMELGTLAQQCYRLFGESVLRDVINRGWDAHAYLGAYLAFYLDDDFREIVDAHHSNPSGGDLYEAFSACKKSPSEKVRKFYKHYRTFAKPTGLGYPGGLGPKTFVEYAHATYGIEVDVELAAELRDVWHRAFPEMRRYLDWINKSCADPLNPDGYRYTTPMGLYRAGASYCAAANGYGLQSPSAEGALLAVCQVVEATYADVGSTLYNDEHGPRHRPQLFIHDELIGEARIDCAHEVAHEVSRLMVESMSMVTPDVTPRAEPVLMTRWSKAAEPVYLEGRLVPWEPKQEQA